MTKDEGKNLRKEIGERLVELSKSRGIDRATLLQAIEPDTEIRGQASHRLSSYQRGLAFPPVPALIALANVLEVSTDYLLTGKEREVTEMPSIKEDIRQTVIEAIRTDYQDRTKLLQQQEAILMQMSRQLPNIVEQFLKRAKDIPPSPEFIHIDDMAKIEKLSDRVILATRDLKNDVEQERHGLIFFLSVVAENLKSSRVHYDYIRPKNRDWDTVELQFKEMLEREGVPRPVLSRRCEFHPTDDFPIIGVIFHHFSSETFESLQFPTEYKKYVFPVDDRHCSGLWMGHIDTPNKYGKFFTLLDYEHAMYGLLKLHEIMRQKKQRVNTAIKSD